ncbi:MAG TPA: glycosyltransferase family 39 protein, partial [Thermomicrobiales bacterium]|nr:glycosyltransferase family 39 protein [Thermomicrobiales bacterium]
MRKRRTFVNRRTLKAPHTPSTMRIAERRREAGHDQDAIYIGPFRITFGLVFFLILVAAAAVRFAGIDWGSSYYLHPDERYVTEVTAAMKWPGSLSAYFDSATSTLNPFNDPKYTSYVYGDFPLLVSKFLGTIVGDTVYGNAHTPGRWLSAISDIGTVAMAGWASRTLFGRIAGLFTATLLAFTALMIQAAHYYTTDSMTGFFVTATMAFVVYASKKRSWAGYMVAGLMFGLAVACKPNAAASVGFFAIPLLEQIRLRGWRSILPQSRARRAEDRFPILIASLVAGFIALWTFRFAQPYAFLGPHWWSFKLDPRWTDNLSY